MEAYDILQAVESNTQARVLATVIHVEGHAYRKQGAVMLLMADGELARQYFSGLFGSGSIRIRTCCMGVAKTANGGVRHETGRRFRLG